MRASPGSNDASIYPNKSEYDQLPEWVLVHYLPKDESGTGLAACIFSGEIAHMHHINAHLCCPDLALTLGASC